MPNRNGRRPLGYLLHKATGQARVRLSGRDIYLGTFGSTESKERYLRLLTVQAAGSGVAAPNGLSCDSALTITELLAAYWRFAQGHYRKNGRPTGQVRIIQDSIRPLRQLYGTQVAGHFGCRELKAVRSAMLATGRRDAIRNSDMTLHDLPNEVGISGGILSRFMRAERSMTLDTAEKLWAYFGLELSPARKGRR